MPLKISPLEHQDDSSSEAGPGWLAWRHVQHALVVLRDDSWILERLCDVEKCHPTSFSGAKATPAPRKTPPNLTLKIVDWRTAPCQPYRVEAHDHVRLCDFPLLDKFLIRKVPNLHMRSIAE